MEEELAMKLMNSLDKAQLEKAIFSKIPPTDIKSSNSSKIKHLEISGLSTLEMNADQQKILFELIEEYISSMPAKLATKRLEQIKSYEISDIYFGWAGENKLTEPHYYFVQGKTFLIELDNTQNNGNHIHRVWRNFDGDFGRDLIKEHYMNSKH